MQTNLASASQREAHQPVRLNIDTKSGTSSIRVSFTDQRLTAHGGMIVWANFLEQTGFRQQLRKVLPHHPTSPNAYDPTDVALGFVAGILCGGDKLSRIAWLQSDPAIAQVLGIEAVASQSTLSRFFEAFGEKTCNDLGALHQHAVQALPSLKSGYTLDLDSWALLHEAGHEEGVAVGSIERGLKPCPRPLVAGLTQATLIAKYWLRGGNSACVNGAAEFLRLTVESLPKHVRLQLVRGDAGFASDSVQQTCVELGLEYICATKLTEKLHSVCRHKDELWSATELEGFEVQEVEEAQPGRRVILIRQRIADQPKVRGKLLLQETAYRYQALVTNLASNMDALNVWQCYQGRADLENRIREMGDQFGIRRLCVRNQWGTEAMHHLAIAAYNLCVLLQRKLGQL